MQQAGGGGAHAGPQGAIEDNCRAGIQDTANLAAPAQRSRDLDVVTGHRGTRRRPKGGGAGGTAVLFVQQRGPPPTHTSQHKAGSVGALRRSARAAPQRGTRIRARGIVCRRRGAGAGAEGTGAPRAGVTEGGPPEQGSRRWAAPAPPTFVHQSRGRRDGGRR